MNKLELAKFKMIKKNDERPGQFSSRTRAIAWCKQQKPLHYYILTTCYREDDLGIYVAKMCWATYLVTKKELKLVLKAISHKDDKRV